MGTLGWKSFTEPSSRTSGASQLVPAPIEHQGVRNALCAAFSFNTDLPVDFVRLLSRIR